MSKEMIISVNGREKKIAILDNGQVTEFYIERGEENSGVVGNIYKGRVQRVLPGMQSAFVEIGLERDAFLYVSDFFDEEEEIERIVMEKGKKLSPEEADPEVTDILQKERLKRDKQIEEVQEIIEPLVESGIEIEGVVPSKIEDEDSRSSKKDGKSRRDRRNRNKNEDAPEETRVKGAETTSEESADDTQLAEKDYEHFLEQHSLPIEEAEPVLFFEIGDSSFERIIDDEETGEMFKDAYLQEAIVDQVRAIEFDMETTDSAEVGSLMDMVSDAPNGFERIADEETEEAEEEKPKKRTSSRKSSKKSEETDEDQIEKKTKRSSRSKSTRKSAKEISEDAEKTVEDGDAENSSKKSKSRTSKRQNKENAETEAETVLENAQAAVTESDAMPEMAVRRGGRGRRNKKKPRQESQDGTENGHSSEDTAEKVKSSNGSSPSRETREPRESRESREYSQPTITDLLREGQEILVQIAKEPIARKGARITSHIALPGRFLVYMPTIEHLGVSRKIESSNERGRLRKLIQRIREEEDIPSGGFIVRTAGVGVPEEELRQDARYLVKTWQGVKKTAEKSKSPTLVHQDLDLIQRLLRDHLSDEYTAIRVDSEEEYMRIVEFVNRIHPRMVNRVKLFTREEPILDAYGVQEEIDKALKPRVWLKSGGYLVINQTEALVAIDVNTGKFVGKGNARLEDTITRTNMEAVQEIARQIRLRDLGGIIVLDLIDMEDRRNRHKVQQALQEALSTDKSPTKVLSFNDFGLIIMTRKRVKQSLERTLCTVCENCEGSGWVKSPQTVCYEILDEARRVSKSLEDVRRTTIRVHPEVANVLRNDERVVFEEIEAYLGDIDITSDDSVHQQQFDFAFI